MHPILSAAMPRKNWPESGFGRRLAAPRKARGLTQVQLARAIDATQRAISYYENEAGYPPAPVVAKLAKALQVSTDQLLGAAPAKTSEMTPDKETSRLWKKFQQTRSLPESDQRAIVRVINSFIVTKSQGKNALRRLG
jgi:transcriptional regulator with XRE-family HTH domain